MIYQFRSKAGPDVIMLADLTKRIFDILGRPLEPRGILTEAQLPALVAVRQARLQTTARDISAGLLLGNFGRIVLTTLR